MIKSRAQLQLMALGLPDTPCNFGGKSSSESSSSNTTNTTTQTTYQDRRNVADGGSNVVSADQSNVFMTNTYSDQGAIKAGVDLGSKALDTSVVLTQAGGAMLDHNIQLAKDLNSSASNTAASAMAQTQAALQVVQSLAALPTKLNDPNRAILIVGMAVVGVAATMMMRGKN